MQNKSEQSVHSSLLYRPNSESLRINSDHEINYVL